MRRLLFGAMMLLLPTSVFATPDLRVAQQELGDELVKDKQYFVRVSCNYRKLSLDKYMSRINRHGEYSKNLDPFASVKHISHFFYLTKSNPVTVGDNWNLAVDKTKLAASTVVPVFAKVKSQGASLKLENNSFCNSKFFLMNTEEYYLSPVLAIARSGRSTALLAATLTFTQSIIDTITNWVTTKPLSSAGDDNFTNAQSLITTYDTYKTKFDGEIKTIQPVKLRVGIFYIRTSATTVKIVVEEAKSYLKAPKYVPFSTKYLRFQTQDDYPDLALVNRSKLNKADVTKLQSACDAQVASYEKKGITSEIDQAFLLGMELDRLNAEYLNLLRCIRKVKLHTEFVDNTVRKYIRLRAPKLSRVDMDDFKKYEINFGAVELDDGKIVPPPPSLTETTKSQERSLVNLFDFYNQALVEDIDKIIGKYPYNVLMNTSKSNVEFVDLAGITGGHYRERNIISIIRLLSEHGYNQMGCYYQNTPQNQKKIGSAVFENSNAVFLVHKAPKRTAKNKEDKILSSETSFVVRTYFDEHSDKISRFVVTLHSSGGIIKQHSTCKQLIKPETKKETPKST